ncbi:flippase [Halobacteriovorax marinus]|uniref:flippase n=1 Tax=Halobacteriovorax marinus TaxID=97084 RepID=UPI003A92F092
MKKIKLLNLNKELIMYAKNTSWLFLDKIVRMGVGFIIIVSLTRYLGAEKYGILSYSQSLVNIFLSFATLGLDTVLVRELVNKIDDEEKLLGTGFILKLIASTFSIGIILFLNYIILNEDQSKTLTTIICFTMLFQSLSVIDSYFQSKVMSKFIVIVNTISFLISSLVKLLLIFFEFDLIWFAYALLFDSIVLSLGYVSVYTSKRSSLLNWRFDIYVAKKLFKMAWPLALVAISAFIYTRIDQVMIKHIIGNEAVGNYAAAIRISELLYFIPIVITTSIFPKIIQEKSSNETRYLYLLGRLYKLVTWVSIPIAITISLLSREITQLLYGNQFTDSANILAILAWGIVFTAISSVFFKILYSERYEKKYLQRSLIGAILNIVLNYLLLHAYGVIGAALATIITLFIMCYIYDLTDKDLRKFYYLKLNIFFLKFKKSKLE